MAIKTTKKQIKENYNKILSVGYCDLQNLLYFERPVFYCSRVEGWACDNYIFDLDGWDVIISTGYSPINNKGFKKDYSKIQKYDKKSKDLCSDGIYKLKDLKNKNRTLIKKMLKELMIR